MTMNYDSAYLYRALELIEKKLGWPASAEWRDFEFTELSEKIYEETGVQLSNTTLKRVFGKVKYESLPSSTTLNALAQFLGYTSWMNFKAEQKMDLNVATDGNTKILTEKKPVLRRLMTGLAAALVISMICGFLFLSSNSTSSASFPKDIAFSSKPLAPGLPNSVVFNVDLKGLKPKELLIQQSWDSTKTVKLKPDQKEATAIYYIPGYFKAKLIVNKKIVKEHDPFIRSDEWMATIDNNPDPPTYLKKEELIQDNGMTIKPNILDKIRQFEKPTTLTYHFVKPFENLHSDNFSLETSFQNTYGDGSAVCMTVKFFVLCSDGAFIIPFTIPGCVSDINLKLGDRTWEGKSNDLSVFGIDPSEQITLKLEVKERHVKIWCNGKLLKEESFQKNAGNVVGFRYSFLGAGKVNFIKVLNADKRVSYENNY